MLEHSVQLLYGALKKKKGAYGNTCARHSGPTESVTKNVLSSDPGWKAEIPSHGATYFLCWSAVHFACCCCFDKSPVRVTAGFWCLLALAAFPVVRWGFFIDVPRAQWCQLQIARYISFSGRTRGKQNTKLFLQVFHGFVSGWTCSFGVRKGSFVVPCILLFFRDTVESSLV